MRASVEQIVSSTEGRVVRGDGAREVHGVSTDTRAIDPEQLFIALEGPNFDGNEFALQACDSNPGALLLRDGHPSVPGMIERLPLEAVVVLHPAPRTALGSLASWHRARLDIPVIGIGAGGKCDGQILVSHDMLGLYTRFHPRFVRRYAEVAETMQGAFEHYVRDVRGGEFPTTDESY